MSSLEDLEHILVRRQQTREKGTTDEDAFARVRQLAIEERLADIRDVLDQLEADKSKFAVLSVVRGAWSAMSSWWASAVGSREQ